jgi:hypothetical protein
MMASINLDLIEKAGMSAMYAIVLTKSFYITDEIAMKLDIDTFVSAMYKISQAVNETINMLMKLRGKCDGAEKIIEKVIEKLLQWSTLQDELYKHITSLDEESRRKALKFFATYAIAIDTDAQRLLNCLKAT